MPFSHADASDHYLSTSTILDSLEKCLCKLNFHHLNDKHDTMINGNDSRSLLFIAMHHKIF